MIGSKVLKKSTHNLLVLMAVGLLVGVSTAHACGRYHHYGLEQQYPAAPIVPAGTVIIGSPHYYHHREWTDVRRCYGHIDHFGYYHRHCYYTHYFR